MANSNNGCGPAVGVFAVSFCIWYSCCGGCGQIDDWEKNRKKASEDALRAKMQAIAEDANRQQKEREAAQIAAKAEQQKNEQAKVDAELQQFAKEFVPDLQKAIERHREQIKKFSDQRSAFARDMAALGIDPETRPAYSRKKELIEKMTKDVDQLLADRQETYIRWREISLLRDTPETRELREKLLKNARSSAKAAEETFDKLMKQSLELDASPPK